MEGSLSISLAGEKWRVGAGEHEIHLPKHKVTRTPDRFDGVAWQKAEFLHASAKLREAQAALGELEIVHLDHEKCRVRERGARSFEDRHLITVSVEFDEIRCWQFPGKRNLYLLQYRCVYFYIIILFVFA